VRAKDRLPALLAGLVRRKMAVIATYGMTAERSPQSPVYKRVS
jgi:hypothetical protein